MVQGPAHTQLATVETRVHMMNHWEADFASGHADGNVEYLELGQGAGRVAMLSGMVVSPHDLDTPETSLMSMHLFRQEETADPTYTVCAQDFPDASGTRGIHTMAFTKAAGVHVLPDASWPVEPHQYFDLSQLIYDTTFSGDHTRMSLLAYRSAFTRIVDMAQRASAGLTPESVRKAARQESWSQPKRLLAKPLGVLGLNQKATGQRLPIRRPFENDA
jgi:hypothetical protein